MDWQSLCALMAHCHWYVASMQDTQCKTRRDDGGDGILSRNDSSVTDQYCSHFDVVFFFILHSWRLSATWSIQDFANTNADKGTLNSVRLKIYHIFVRTLQEATRHNVFTSKYQVQDWPLFNLLLEYIFKRRRSLSLNDHVSTFLCFFFKD